MYREQNKIDNMNFETQAIRTQIDTTGEKEHSTPLYLTSSFVFDDAEEMRATFAAEKQRNIYSRFTNPNANEFIDKLCLLEGAEKGMATATGMSAVFSTFAALCSAGDEILACKSIFGSTHSVFTKLLPKWNIKTTYFGVKQVDKLEEFVNERIKVVYIESPTNPAIDILDIEKVADFCKKHNLILVVDNCFATPYVQQPIKFGADIVIHSATKFIDGQGRVMGGAVLGKKELIEDVYGFVRMTGPSISPFNAWVLSKSLETLALRMDRHAENAHKLAQFIEIREEVKQVKYPFLESHPQYEIAKKQMRNGGGLLSFELKGGLEAGKSFLNGVKMASLTANLGDTRTIVSHPSSTTHAKLTEEERLSVGITPGLIRISVGLEHIDDIIADMKLGFNSVV